MSELEEFRRELDELRERVAMVESQATSTMGEVASAQVLARQADRNMSGYRVEIREGLAMVNDYLAQITALLTASAEASR